MKPINSFCVLAAFAMAMLVHDKATTPPLEPKGRPALLRGVPEVVPPGTHRLIPFRVRIRPTPEEEAEIREQERLRRLEIVKRWA